MLENNGQYLQYRKKNVQIGFPHFYQSKRTTQRELYLLLK